jgi:hypothetical protein
MELRKATRSQAKLRIGVTGPSGSGKTYSSLLIARGMTDSWDKVALIDTENGSGDLYSHLGDYNVLTLQAPFSPEKYIEAIKACEEGGVEVIVIDSTSHEWDGPGGCLEIQEKLGGKFQDWAKVTPRHRAFIDAILKSPCHVITTNRKKQDWSMDKDSNGKTTVEKLGLKDVQREGFEYELTLSFDVTIRHLAKASKDRTGLFMDKPEFVITEETGRTLKEWAESGEEDPLTIKRAIIAQLRRLKLPDVKDGAMIASAIKNNTGMDISNGETKNLKAILEALKNLTGLVEDGGSDDMPDIPGNDGPTPPVTPPETNNPAPSATQTPKADTPAPKAPERTPAEVLAASPRNPWEKPTEEDIEILKKITNDVDFAPIGDEAAFLAYLEKDHGIKIGKVELLTFGKVREIVRALLAKKNSNATDNK